MLINYSTITKNDKIVLAARPGRPEFVFRLARYFVFVLF